MEANALPAESERESAGLTLQTGTQGSLARSITTV
jgi:hypothetical protein